MRARIEPKLPDLDREVGAAALHQRVKASDELLEGERLRQVVVAAGREAGEPVGERVAGGEEDDGRRRSLRAERLHDVAPIRVGEADVDDQRVRLLARQQLEQLCRAPGGRDSNPSSRSPRVSSERSSASSSSTMT